MRIAVAALLTLSLALAGCSKGDPDSDKDGVSDSQERNGWTVTVDYLHERVRYDVESDAHKDDSDGDGLPDNEEFLLGLDPTLADTDKDGLTDCQEERHTVQAECEDPPSGLDADGGYHTDPKRADSDGGTARFVRQPGWFTDKTGTLADGPTAGDGVSDGDEVLGYSVAVANGGSRTVTSDPRDPDSDDDGLGDGEEREYKGDPTVPDTDGDGCDDGGDPFPDRDERLSLGSLAFTAGPRPVRLHLELLVTGALVRVPQAGTVDVSAGQTASLPVPAPIRPNSCTFPAWQPVTPVEVNAYSDGQALDVHSENPGASAFARWDMRSGALSWSEGGAATRPLEFRGPDGAVKLDPAVQ